MSTTDSQKFKQRQSGKALGMHVTEEAKMSEGRASNETSIEDMFGKIFGIERVHLLQQNDRLQDVTEKL